MAKTAVKKLVCGSCGAEVREASSFCYNCGGPVSDIFVGKTRQIQTDIPKTRPAEETSGPKKVEKKFVQPEIANAKLRDTTDSKAEKLTKLQSASALRRRNKTFNRKPVQVFWTERGDSPARFVIVSVILALFAGFLLFLAFYLR